MSPLLPAAPTRGRRISGAVKTTPEVPRDRAVVGKRDRGEPATKGTVAKSMTCLPTGTRIVVARTPGGRYASHSNDLVHLTVTTRHRPLTHTRNPKAARAMPQHAVSKAALSHLLEMHTGKVTGTGSVAGQASPRAARAVAAVRTGRRLANRRMNGVKPRKQVIGKAVVLPTSRMPERGRARVGLRLG